MAIRARTFRCRCRSRSSRSSCGRVRPAVHGPAVQPVAGRVDVKYFSGTAAYSTVFSLPPETPARGRRLYLDLGDVQVMADVKLNGKELGILWKPPYRVDVTDAVQAGENRLEVSVVNLWINRLIGDEQLPDDSPRANGMTLSQWPQWLLEGKPSPTGRFTFTSHRLWKKGDPLVASGLIGPVLLRAAQETRQE